MEVELPQDALRSHAQHTKRSSLSRGYSTTLHKETDFLTSVRSLLTSRNDRRLLSSSTPLDSDSSEFEDAGPPPVPSGSLRIKKRPSSEIDVLDGPRRSSSAVSSYRLSRLAPSSISEERISSQDFAVQHRESPATAPESTIPSQPRLLHVPGSYKSYSSTSHHDDIARLSIDDDANASLATGEDRERMVPGSRHARCFHAPVSKSSSCSSKSKTSTETRNGPPAKTKRSISSLSSSHSSSSIHSPSSRARARPRAETQARPTPVEALPASKVKGTPIAISSGHTASQEWIRNLLQQVPPKGFDDNSTSDLTAMPPQRPRSIRAGIQRRDTLHFDSALPSSSAAREDRDVRYKSDGDEEEYRRKASASFTRSIGNMENLLNEALFIAREATEKDVRVDDNDLAAPSARDDALSTPHIHTSLPPLHAESALEQAQPSQVGEQLGPSSNLGSSMAPRNPSEGNNNLVTSRYAYFLDEPEPQTVVPALSQDIQPDQATDLHTPEISTGNAPRATSEILAPSVNSNPQTPPRFYGYRPLNVRDRAPTSETLTDGARTQPESHTPLPDINDLTPAEAQNITVPSDIVPSNWAGPDPTARPLRSNGIGHVPEDGLERHDSRRPGRRSPFRAFSLRDRHHVDIRNSRRFNLSRTHRRKPIAREWGTLRKRYVATIACISTALIGTAIGIYAGEVPAIQYQVVDQHHHVVLGNVLLYIGLAIPTLFFWPLPLLHGRKPYTLFALSIFLPLQVPQAIVVSTQRSPYVATYLVALLLSRAASGLALGFANINLLATLLDLFGSSLRSGHPHQEVVASHDYRHQGGGMGLWLGIWSWCYIGSIGLGFLFGALIIYTLNPSWGFWITVVLTATVLLLNVVVPEVRRSSFRRSVAEVRTESDVARRVARGEIKMHISSTGPKWWWEEVHAGLILSWRMLRQSGFAVLSLYLGWVYAQIVMIVILLGALTSKYYHFRSPYVGLCVTAIPIGALLAVPFQKASLFSRSRKHAPRTDSMTFEKRITWSSHLVRRAIFMIALPFANLAYTLSSKGPPTHYMWPTFFAGLIGFLSALALAEGCGLVMETYDTSDLQPGMTGRRPDTNDMTGKDPRRTNFSCYPRVSAALAIIQTWGFLLASAATGAGGGVERRLGAELATGIVAAILLFLTLLLIVVLWRHQEVQVVPSTIALTAETRLAEEDWMPVIIGNPSGRTRRMSLLELGNMSRWSEIRRRNRLVNA